jgi:hypothetical protein
MSHETTSSGGGASPEITTSSSTDEASVPLALKERLAQKLAAKVSPTSLDNPVITHTSAYI